MAAHLRKSSLVALAAALLLIALPGAATASTGPCGETSFEQPFLPWGDSGLYSLVPSGGFEGGAPDWALDGAELVGDAHGGDAALALEPGDSALSGPVCVAAGYSHARMFARTGAGHPADARLRVDVLGTDAEAGGVVGAESGWGPTRIVPLGEPGFALDPATGTGTIRLRLRAVGSQHAAPFVVDDVYVDPWARR